MRENEENAMQCNEHTDISGCSFREHNEHATIILVAEVMIPELSDIFLILFPITLEEAKPSIFHHKTKNGNVSSSNTP